MLKQFINGLSIRASVYFTLSVLTLLFLFVAIINVVANKNMARFVDEASTLSISLQRNIEDMRYIVINTQRLALQGVLLDDETQLLLASKESVRFYEVIEKATGQLDRLHRMLEKSYPDHRLHFDILNSAVGLLGDLKADYADYLQTILSQSAVMVENARHESEMVERVKSAQQLFNARLNELSQNINEIVRDDAGHIVAEMQLPVYFAAISMVAGLILSVGLALLLGYKLTSPLSRIGSFLHDLRDEGYYKNNRIELNRNDELGLLAHEINDMLANIETITVSKEKLLLAKEEAEKANQAKSIFLSNMSHEFRTPLNAIIGFSQLLDDDVIQPAQKENVGEILKAGERLLGLVNDILDYSKSEAGALEVSLEYLPLVDVIKDAMSSILPLASEKGIGPTLVLHSEDITCLADGKRLGQVLINLLSNAIKYNKPHGAIEVSTEQVSEKKVRVVIADTGIGISEFDLARLFRPFERVKSAEHYAEGSGIGLALCKQYISLMRGTIGAQSESGVGSKFFIELETA